MKKFCCICGAKTSSRFSSSRSYEQSFKGCFAVDKISGYLCNSCRCAVLAFKKDSDKATSQQYSDKVDSHGEPFINITNLQKASFSARVRPDSVNTDKKLNFHCELGLFSVLPDDVALRIISLLPVRDVFVCSRLSRRSSQICSHPILWKKLSYRDYAEVLDGFSISASDSDCSPGLWKDIYKVAFKCEQNCKVLMNENQTLAQQIEKQNSQLTVISPDQACNSSSTITGFEEAVFRMIVKKKQMKANDGYIYASNKHGRPLSLLIVRKPEVSSNEASKSTIKARSQCQEHFTQVILFYLFIPCPE